MFQMIKRNDNEQELNFVKYPRIPYLEDSKELYGREVYVFEKIDGSLSQVRRTEFEILGGSKANYIKGSTKRPAWSPKFLKWMHSNPSLYNLKPGLIMFGEWLQPVTLDYKKENLDQFYFIDLANVEDGKPKFFDYDEALRYLDEWGVKGIRVLPPIGKIFLNESNAMNIVLDNESQLRDGEMEGIVLKNYILQDFVKCLHPRHTEIRKQEHTLDEKYITPVRVSKAQRRLSDRGDTVNLDSLVEEIRLDIQEESGIAFDIEAVRGSIRARDLYRNN